MIPASPGEVSDGGRQKAGRPLTPTPLAAVIGSPVAHSLSPALHRAAFAAAGLDWSYVAFEVASGDGARAVEAMRILGIVGLSVTMPHKQAVARAVDRLEPAAVALGAVNTVSWEDDELVGSSTDGDGFVASLRDAGHDPAGRRIGVIGAGGAAASVVDALGRAGAASIVVANRTLHKAERVASLAAHARIGGADELADCDVVVNATSIGMGSVGMGSDSSLPCPIELLGADTVVADLVYHPLVTPWLEQARRSGLPTVDGLGMLVHQAALQQLRWTGHLPDVVAMRAAADAALRARQPDA